MAEIGSAVAAKVVDSLIFVAKKEISYMWNCSKYVERFKQEAENLKDMRGRVQQLIDISIRKGDRLSYGVEDWVKEADMELYKAHEYLEQEANAKKTCCKIGLCGNWGTLHRYGKMATRLAPSLLQLQERGSTYERCISIETPAPRPLYVYQNKDLDGLHTHNLALGDIMKSLEDESIQIIGIYGSGGVGKTTLTLEVPIRVKNKFADVAFTTVSQNIDIENIKKDIGGATNRIRNGDKILIILDDVREKLNLEELGIPCGSNYLNCKILLTSRSEKVCQEMNAQSKICVSSLPTKEAWILFKRVVGERLEMDAKLKQVARKVVDECGGLPLLIQVVGNALKDQSIKSWNSALTQLRKRAPLEIDEEIGGSFKQLKLSYDYLISEEAKWCFLLCSLFPVADSISLEDLVFYGVGLEMFDDLDSIEDSRGRVQNAVNILTSSGFLLNSKRKGWTKMHDGVHDVALLIASEGKNKFLVEAGKGLREWQPGNESVESYTGISLMYNKICKLPDYKVNLPHLEILLVHGNGDLSLISDEFIGCMKNVKVLDISWNNISSLPRSFQFLTKLRTLNLRGNKCLHEIMILGELKDLEILILNGTGITEIPKEIAQLVKLRVLEVKDCVDLSRITQGVISALSRLEELCIDLSRMSEGVNSCTGEVMKLSNLKYLDLTVKSFDLISEGFNSENLKGFVIQIGDFYRGNEVNELRRSDRYLIISSEHLVNSLLKWLKRLIEVSRPCILLNGIENLNNIMPTVYDEGFNKLEHIELIDCFNMSYLVDDSTSSNGDKGKIEEPLFKELKHLKLGSLNKLKGVWKCQDEFVSLTNLVSLSIYNCNKLERVFTVHVAQGLVNLKELSIVNCDHLEEVIWGGDGGDDVIVFPSLAEISLLNLGRLKSFYSGSENRRFLYPSLVEVQIPLCSSMKIWGPGIHETPILKKTVVDHVNVSRSINEVVKVSRDVEMQKRKQAAAMKRKKMTKRGKTIMVMKSE